MLSIQLQRRDRTATPLWLASAQGWRNSDFRSKGKSSEDKIVVPVLFGRKGKILKCFNADAHAVSMGWVLEVEACRAVDNNQFLKDIFQACMMHNVLRLAIAVRNTYRSSDDFAKVENFLETLYVSGRLQLPLKGILLIGY
jgi:hypothetical protein